MALTKCNVPKDVIGSLGTNPSERGLTTQQFKDKFDEMPEGIIDYLNNTLTPELDGHIDGVASETVFTTHETSVAGVQTVTGLTAGKVPKRIEIRTGVNDASTCKMSIGSWEANGPAQSVVGFYKNGTIYATTYSNTCAVIALNDSTNYIRGTVQNVTEDQFEINWVKSGAPTGVIALQVIAHYH